MDLGPAEQTGMVDWKKIIPAAALVVKAGLVRI
jgi:hypothetical protein